MQFTHINISDRVSGIDVVTHGDIRNSRIEFVVEDQDCLHEQTKDINATYLTTDTEFLIDRLKAKRKVYRTLSCPDLAKGIKYCLQEDEQNNNLTPPDSDSEDDELSSIRTLFQTSTPVEEEGENRLSYPVNIRDILHDPQGLQVP